MFVHESRVKEIIDPLLINVMFELDFHENSNMSPTHSYNDDEPFLRKVSDGTKFASDKGCKEDYVAFMNQMIMKGYAERVPTGEETTEDGKCWYILHHGVYHPKKPKKIRLVFDCSSCFKART